MNIYLLTHQRELERKTNTGVLVADVLGENCSVFEWSRVNPSKVLLNKIESESVALVYPCEDSRALAESCDGFDSFIIIDATWQEAQKIYNHSPYLQQLTKVSIRSNIASIYTLRRNQKEHGLCTAECASEILKSCGFLNKAENIESRLAGLITSMY